MLTERAKQTMKKFEICMGNIDAEPVILFVKGSMAGKEVYSFLSAPILTVELIDLIVNVLAEARAQKTK